MTIIERVRHRVVSHEADWRIGRTACGIRVALVGGRCPSTPEHLIALPSCPNHGPITSCGACG